MLYIGSIAVNKKILILASVMVLSVISAFVTILHFSQKSEYIQTHNYTYDDVLYDTVIIDAGHGGFDGGAVGESGTLEKDINLSLSFVLNDLFLLTDIDARMTRTSDELLLDDDNNTLTKKSQDLNNRVEFSKQFYKPLFVSIHQNKFPVSRYSGLQVYYSQNNENSKIVAENIQQTIKNTLQNDNNREIKSAGRNIYVLRKLLCPAVLVECGFLSNPQEEKMLRDADYQKKLAICIFSSIIKTHQVKL